MTSSFSAIDDAVVDGGDTKEFAASPNTLSGILGPVIVDGAGGAAVHQIVQGEQAQIPALARRLDKQPASLSATCLRRAVCIRVSAKQDQGGGVFRFRARFIEVRRHQRPGR